MNKSKRVDQVEESWRSAHVLREEFDTVFSQPLPTRPSFAERVIVVRLGSAEVAVRLSELKGVHALPKLELLPGTVRHRLGICGIGDLLVPVYDLAGLIDSLPCSDPKIVLLVGGRDVLGLACDGLIGQLWLTVEQIRETNDEDSTARFAVAIAYADGGSIPVLHLRRIVERIQPRTTSVKER